MSLKDVEKTPCIKCDGKGYVGKITHHNISYKIVCPRCLGKKQLDWIEHIRPPVAAEWLRDKTGYDALTIVIGLKQFMRPDNYVYVFGGTTYFIKKDYFDMSKSTRKRWSCMKLNTHFLKENPDALTMWR